MMAVEPGVIRLPLRIASRSVARPHSRIYQRVVRRRGATSPASASDSTESDSAWATEIVTTTWHPGGCVTVCDPNGVVTNASEQLD